MEPDADPAEPQAPVAAGEPEPPAIDARPPELEYSTAVAA
jgi:hypothetical protein